MTRSAPPAHLSKETASWWGRVVKEYELAEHHVRLLTLAGEAFDRAQEARRVLKAEGTYYLDRFGQPKAHPAAGIERDSRIQFARLIRELDLDGEPLPDPRPPRR